MVKRILGPDFRLDDRMELTIDVEKRPFPKTVAAKQELLKKIVQFQIENSLLSGIDMAEAKKQQIHRYELRTTKRGGAESRSADHNRCRGVLQVPWIRIRVTCPPETSRTCRFR